MENTIIRIIADALLEEFWSEESLMVSKYAEIADGEQLDCEMLTIVPDGNKIAISIEGKETHRYVISVTEKEN